MRRRKDVSNRSVSLTYQFRRRDDVSAWSATSRPIWDPNETSLRRRTPGGLKFIMADFYEIEFMKGTLILVKVDEIYNILKSLLATPYWLRDESGIWWSKFFSGISPSISIRFLRSCFIKGQASSPCHDVFLLSFHNIYI